MKILLIIGTMLSAGVLMVWSIIDEIKYRKRINKK